MPPNLNSSYIKSKWRIDGTKQDYILDGLYYRRKTILYAIPLIFCRTQSVPKVWLSNFWYTLYKEFVEKEGTSCF